ncbi:MAG: hypothetical protein ACI8S6_000546 [Myxococcota bacterium]|jgi:uncharacterized protein YjbI with pentapeptide repeats
MWSILLVATAFGQELTPVEIGGDVVPMVGTSTHSQGNDERAISVNLIGYAGGIDGVELSAVAAIDRLHMHGVQLAGAANLVGADVEGIQAAGAVNIVGQGVDGLQFAGGANIAGGSVDGVQGSGGANIVGLDVDGVQLAGGANITGGSVDGVQGAGGVNITGGVVDGAQLAGGLNIAGGIDGVQIAAANFSGGHVSGAQIGVVNIARTSDFSLGLVNIIWEGRTHVDVWATETGFINAAFKHGGERFHYIYGAGYRPGSGDLPGAWSGMVGMGGHTELTQRLFVDSDVISAYVHDAEAAYGLNLLNTARLVGGVQLTHRLALLAGPTYNVLVSETCGPKYAGPGTTVFNPGPVQVRGWPGVMVGVQLL